MSRSCFEAALQALLRPVAGLLSSAGVTANQVTVTAALARWRLTGLGLGSHNRLTWRLSQ
jgi:hypothetical protein